MAWLCSFTPSLSIWTKNSVLTNSFENFFEKLFLWFLRVKIYSLTYTHKNGVLIGCFWEWFTVCLQNQGSDAVNFQWSKLGRWFSGKWRRCSFKICSSPICMKTAFCGGGFKKDSQHVYKSAPSKKHPLPIPIKIAVCTPSWEQCLPFVYRNPVLQIILSPNSHRKAENKPLLKNIPHLYEKKSRFLHLILKACGNIFTICLQESTLWAEFTMWDTFKTSKWGLASCLKNIPHLIGQKIGKIHPSLRIVYFLFTKIDLANKKCAFRRIKKRAVLHLGTDLSFLWLFILNLSFSARLCWSRQGQMQTVYRLPHKAPHWS